MSDGLPSPTSAVPLLARQSFADWTDSTDSTGDRHANYYDSACSRRDRCPSHDEKLYDERIPDDESDAPTFGDLESLDKNTLALSNLGDSLCHSRMRHIRVRLTRCPLLLVAAIALLLGILLGVLHMAHIDTPRLITKVSAPGPQSGSHDAVAESSPPLPEPMYDPDEESANHPERLDEEKKPVTPGHSEWAMGPPTESFRGVYNLRNDTEYITSWIAAGWTNDFITYANLLYLAFLTGRAAVLPPFSPSHLPEYAGFIHVGDVFDLPRLSQLMHGQPILEWRDLKIPGSTFADPVGCWSIWSTSQGAKEDHRPRENPIESVLSLDVSYTPVPTRAIMYPQTDNDHHTRFGDLAAIAFPDGRKAASLPDTAPFPSPRGHTALPDEHLACYDFPYYVAEADAFEFTYDYSPMWRFVGKHAHFTPRIEALGRDVVRRTLGLEEDEDLPPFVSVHVRHGDFKVYCADGEGGILPGCYAPLRAFARRVRDVQDELRAIRGVEASEVLVTSDESDETWWAEVEAFGWRRVNHIALRTEERLGVWYPVLLDAVVHSLGTGFVGTDRSTMSIMARRRVIDWNDGVGVEVRWGYEGADDH